MNAVASRPTPFFPAPRPNIITSPNHLNDGDLLISISANHNLSFYGINESEISDGNVPRETFVILQCGTNIGERPVKDSVCAWSDDDFFLPDYFFNHLFASIYFFTLSPVIFCIRDTQ